MAVSRLVSFAEKIIKPYSPTPLSLQRYTLSLIDQYIYPIHMPVAAFYPFPSKKPEQISNLLEKSLSRILSSYYPFAGRLQGNSFVDCNDMGTKFVNVKYDIPMSEVVNLPDTGPEYLPFPKGTPNLDEETLLVIQLSHFNCGGFAISVNLSHKVADACTLCNFISDWAAITRDHNAKIPLPQMNGSSIFKPSTDEIPRDTTLDNQSMGTKRYVFPNSKLKLLKSVVESETGVQNPTRVEVLSALLYKCATTAARVNSGSFKLSGLNQLVNLRPILDPPLPTRTIGNILSTVVVLTFSESEMTIPKVVRELRKAKEEFKKEDHVRANKLVSLVALGFREPEKRNAVDLYQSSSLCNYPLNNLDFGMGKPCRVIFPVVGIGNTFVLMDNQSGDGVEAIVPLPERDIVEFENSKEILEFASPIP